MLRPFSLAGSEGHWSRVAATLLLDGRAPGSEEVSLSAGLFEDLEPVVYRASMVLGYVAVVLLLVAAAQWRRRVEPRVPGSTAAHLVPLGFVASAAGLTYGYGWKGALGTYAPGGPEAGWAAYLAALEGLAASDMIQRKAAA